MRICYKVIILLINVFFVQILAQSLQEMVSERFAFYYEAISRLERAEKKYIEDTSRTAIDRTISIQCRLDVFIEEYHWLNQLLNQVSYDLDEFKELIHSRLAFIDELLQEQKPMIGAPRKYNCSIEDVGYAWFNLGYGAYAKCNLYQDEAQWLRELLQVLANPM
jgi:hypothetical protein